MSPFDTTFKSVLIFCPSDHDDGVFVANELRKKHGCAAYAQSDIKMAKEHFERNCDGAIVIVSGINRQEKEFINWLEENGHGDDCIAITKNEAVGLAMEVFGLGFHCCFVNKGYSKFIMSECMDSMFGHDGSDLWYERRGTALKSCCERMLSEGKSQKNLLIKGDQGCGKRSAAHIIHKHGNLKGKFVMADCSGFEEVEDCTGPAYLAGDLKRNNVYLSIQQMLEHSNGGTLLFSQVDLLSEPMQSFLAEALEGGKFFDVKSKKCRAYKGRLIFTTFDDRIEEKVMNGQFSDKLYRLMSESVMRLPSFSECKEDVVPLAEAFIEAICKDKGYAVPSLSQLAKDKLRRHIWIGNMSELYSSLSASCAFGRVKTIEADDIFLMEPIGHMLVPKIGQAEDEEGQSDARQCV